MSTPINIHPDFQKIRGMKLSFSSMMLSVMNAMLHLAAARKWSKYKAIAKKHVVTGIDGHRVAVWLIRPAHVTAIAPALVYCHGGAFVIKHSPQHIENAIRYAEDANCCVLFVDYRLAPQNPFPAGFNDCYSTLMWASQNAEKLGIDKQRIAIGGDSAGGAIAAGVAQKVAHENKLSLRGQLLIYPVADSDCKTTSGTGFADVPPFKQFSLVKMWEAYLGHPPTSGVPAYASPLHSNLKDLAPAYVETGEYDPLRDEGINYAKALAANGVAVELNETKGTVHGFDALVPQSRIAKAAIEQRATFLRHIFR
ncbi:MAG: alpha/beta hydrolase [Spongiibacteraceae bacterium]